MTTELKKRDNHESFLFTREPFAALSRMREYMDEMFNELFRFEHQKDVEGKPTYTPAINMYQEGDNVVVESAMPGLKKEELHIEATPDMLTLSGEYRREKTNTGTARHPVYHSELRSGSYYRMIRLPMPIKTEAIKAEMTDGMLKVTMPMLEPASKNTVKVEVK